MKTTLCYIQRDGKYLMMYRNKKSNDIAEGKYLGIGGKFQGDETPDECLLREAMEETGFALTDYQYRGIVYFVSDRWENEDMYLYTATGFTFADGSEVPEGYLPECNEGTFEWIDVDKVESLPMWEGDKHFFHEIAAGNMAIDMTLSYVGDDLVSAENRNPA